MSKAMGNIAKYSPLPGYIDDSQLSYQEKIFVTPCSPVKLYTYWHMDAANFQEFYLRLYSGNKCLEQLRIPPFTGNWFFENLQPGCEYHVELGLINDGKFQSLLRSAQVATPPDRPSTIYAPGWEPVLTDDELDKLGLSQNRAVSSYGASFREW